MSEWIFKQNMYRIALGDGSTTKSNLHCTNWTQWVWGKKNKTESWVSREVQVNLDEFREGIRGGNGGVALGSGTGWSEEREAAVGSCLKITNFDVVLKNKIK